MRRASWPRFGVEAAFLILVAVGAGMLDLDRGAIIGVMAVAYIAVVTVEWSASRRARAAASPTHDGSSAGVGEAPEPAGRSDAPARGRRARHVRVLSETAPADERSEPAAVGTPPALAEPLPPAGDAGAGGDADLAEPGEAAEPEAGAAEAVDVAPPEPEPQASAPSDADLAPPEREPELQAAEDAESFPEPEPEAATAEAEPAGADAPREWNLWELERAVRDAPGDDPALEEERAFLLVYLREFAGADGVLPVDFDGLVRDSFGDVIGVAPR